jgi:succinate dehydrogenase/fumarate reductase cytochrome b subunit
MGTNYIIKVFEVILMAAILFHACLTLWLAYTNFKARGSVRYHHASRTKTHTGSKLMAWTGGLIIVLLLIHFCDFYFVKLGWVKGEYMVKTEEVNKIGDDENAITMLQVAQYGDVKEYIENQKAVDPQKAQKLEEYIPLVDFVKNMESKLSADKKYLKGLSEEDKNALSVVNDIDVEPDFYTMARNKFHNPWICLAYLFCFIVLWFHLRHAVPSVFQTLGWNNYTYNKAIDIFGICYAWLVALIFASIPIVVYFFL